MGDLFNEGYKNGYKDGVKECEPYMWEWISVKDALPSQDQFVLAVPKDINCPAVLRFQAGAGSGNGYLFMWPDLKGQVLNISHWMPLPNPPKEESNHE